jgi:hypothetical protein
VGRPVGHLGHQPFAEEIAHLERQAEQDVARFRGTGTGRRTQQLLDLGVVERVSHDHGSFAELDSCREAPRSMSALPSTPVIRRKIVKGDFC